MENGQKRIQRGVFLDVETSNRLTNTVEWIKEHDDEGYSGSTLCNEAIERECDRKLAKYRSAGEIAPDGDFPESDTGYIRRGRPRKKKVDSGLK